MLNYYYLGMYVGFIRMKPWVNIADTAVSHSYMEDIFKKIFLQFFYLCKIMDCSVKNQKF